MRFEEKEIKERLLSLQRNTSILAEIIADRQQNDLSTEEIKTLFLEAQTKTPEEAKVSGIIKEIREVQMPKDAMII